MPKDDGPTRIQVERRARILDAGLEVFSAKGFAGATLDGIAAEAGLSKPNLLYYFPGKEAIYHAVLDRLLETWLDPLRALDPEGDPLEEMLAYVRRKLVLARDYPRQSRLFAGEMLAGAPVMGDELAGDLRAHVEHHGAIIGRWMEAGRLAKSDPKLLIFSIWAETQHYADFEVQVRAVLGTGEVPWDEVDAHLQAQFRRMLTVG